MINGVIIKNQKIIPHESGNIFHGLKRSDEEFSTFGEAYFSCVDTGKVKGWKKHKEAVLNLVVPVGKIRFVIYDDRTASSTKDTFQSIELSEENYARLTIPPDLWVAFQGVGENRNMLLNVSSCEHDPNEAITESLDHFQFDWSQT